MTENLNKTTVEVNVDNNKETIEKEEVKNENEQKIKTREEREEREIREERKENPEKQEQEEERQKGLLKADLKVEYESLKKQLNDSKSWGHKKNAAYVHAKKKITEFLSKLKEDALIGDDEISVALKAFDDTAINLEESKEEDNKGNSYADLKANLDKEFAIYKKYNKDSELDEKYQAFFGFIPLMPTEEQEKIVDYITSETPEVAIDHIITTGSDIYETLFKGSKKNGGIVPFVKSLHSKIEKLEQKIKDLQQELDTTEGTVHNRSINSKVSNLASTKPAKSFADIWQN
jgi:hypothetical protein